MHLVMTTFIVHGTCCEAIAPTCSEVIILILNPLHAYLCTHVQGHSPRTHFKAYMAITHTCTTRPWPLTHILCMHISALALKVHNPCTHFKVCWAITLTCTLRPSPRPMPFACISVHSCCMVQTLTRTL